MTTTERPKRRWPRPGIMLLVAIILLVGAGVLSVWLPYHREQSAIAAIEAAGIAANEAVGGWVHTEPGGPDWLRELVGDDYMRIFDRIVAVDFGEEPIDDNFLKHFAGLTRLRTLTLHNTQITDAGLEHLVGLTNLSVLHLGDTQITDAGLSHLAALNGLKGLSLEYTQVTNAGLGHLTGLTGLEVLSLDGTRVTKEGVEKLQKALPRCVIVF